MNTTRELSDRLSDLCGEVGRLEEDLSNARHELETTAGELAAANTRIGELSLELIEHEGDQEVYELIGDLKRGVISIEELYERTIGS